MSPAMAVLVKHEQRAGPYIGGLLVLAIPILGIGYLTRELTGAIILCLAVSTVIASLYWLWVLPRARQDLDNGVFVRSRGQIGLSRIDEGPDYILAPDGARLSVDLDVVKAYLAMHPPRGEVDYAPRSELLFEIRDSAGAVVWRHRRLGS